MKPLRPVLIVNSVVMDKNKVLLIKRVKPPYVGYWGMPGGKVEFCEHIEQAAVRELKEETDIDAEFDSLCGIASEIIHENNEEKGHFIIFVCKLKHLHTNALEKYEGKVKWIDLDNLDKEKIIPSDVLMIKEFVLKNKNLDIHKIKMIQDGEEYFVEEFGT